MVHLVPPSVTLMALSLSLTFSESLIGRLLADVQCSTDDGPWVTAGACGVDRFLKFLLGGVDLLA